MIEIARGGVWLLAAASLAVVSCSTGLGVDGQQQPTQGGSAGAVASAPPQTRHVSGQLIAHVDVTATHTVEFWETRPGSVMMLQKLNVPAGDKSLDLGPMLLEAGGTYGGLYRKLLAPA